MALVELLQRIPSDKELPHCPSPDKQTLPIFPALHDRMSILRNDFV